MISPYTQAGRAMTVTTPLGDDVVLLTGFDGHEAISQLFEFRLALAAFDQTKVDFSAMLGGSVTVHIRTGDSGGVRHFNGICRSLSQGIRGAEFTSFEAEIVPAFWRATQRTRSRIFQQQTVPQILRAVLGNVPGVDFDIDESGFLPRNYCVQYRESDFHFASRLMEEEGIYYYFIHLEDDHRMVVANREIFPALAPDSLIYQPLDDGMVDEQRITRWTKRQTLKATKVTLRDHNFQLPHDPLETNSTIQPSVTVGQVEHQLDPDSGESTELGDWPGEYANRLDAVNQHGNLGDIQGMAGQIKADRARTAAIRMEQEAVEAISIEAQSSYRQLGSGGTFSVQEQVQVSYDGQSTIDGRYLITGVSHRGENGLAYRSGESATSAYENRFSCIPTDLRYRPRRVTPKPVATGPQSAVVVKGPGDDEIWTDPFGRVKVKFHWDVDNPANPDSSCWIRVAHGNSGGQFGMIYVPRGDQEVVVEFQEGDLDRPIITGSLYNPNIMPPFTLPDLKMVSGMRSNTYKGGGGFNEFSLDDTKGNERVYVHAQHDHDTKVNNNRSSNVGVDQSENVGNNVAETVGNNKTVFIAQDVSKTVGANKSEFVGQNKTVEVVSNHAETIGSNKTVSVVSNHVETVGANKAVNVVGDHEEGAAGNKIEFVGMTKTETVTLASTESVGAAKALNVGAAYAISVGGVMNTFVGLAQFEEVLLSKTVLVGTLLELICGAGKITIDSGGKITLDGTEILLNATGPVKINGSVIDLN